MAAPSATPSATGRRGHVAVLVYAALSGTQGAHGLGAALIASVAFLVVSAALPGRPVPSGRREHRPATAVPGALAIAMRDFAVAAALASQAFGNRAAAVPGVYGVVMLLAGSGFVTLVRRRGGLGDPAAPAPK